MREKERGLKRSSNLSKTIRYHWYTIYFYKDGVYHANCDGLILTKNFVIVRWIRNVGCSVSDSGIYCSMSSLW